MAVTKTLSCKAIDSAIKNKIYSDMGRIVDGTSFSWDELNDFEESLVDETVKQKIKVTNPNYKYVKDYLHFVEDISDYNFTKGSCVDW